MEKYRVEVDECGSFWYKLGTKIFHRLDGPAVEWRCGNKEWFKNGKRHRLDGPATEYDGDKFWFQNGKLHREDGPAIEYSDGRKEYWTKGKKITEEEFKKCHLHWRY